MCRACRATVSDGNKVGLNDAGETATGSVSDTHTFCACVHIVDATLGVCMGIFFEGGISAQARVVKASSHSRDDCAQG